MSTYKIITDVGSDLLKIDGLVLPMEVSFDDEHYLYGPNGELTIKAFYEKLDDYKVAKTSQITPASFIRLLDPLLKEGYDIIYLSLSSKLSGTYSSSIIATNELIEYYPHCKITCIDSKLASTALGALVLEAIKQKNNGLDYVSLINWIYSKISHVSNAVVVDDLSTLKQGGRISQTVNIAGKVLNLKPILQIESNGEIGVKDKVRGRNGTIRYLTDFYIKQSLSQNISTIYIGHANNPNYALMLKNSILQHDNNIDIITLEIGPVIASHAGANTLMIAII